ncbi:MAG: hypothetical protein HYW96_01285 [Candidatus Wildermuthbacteria bacterium]|nr:hypothetical protein [Candidatus Wildermuthbacteria bacterium]
MSTRFLAIAFALIVFGVFVLPVSVTAQDEPLPTCEQKPRSVGDSIISRVIGFVNPIWGSKDLLSKPIDQYYECTGHIPSAAKQIDRSVDCITACSDAKGFVLEYTDVKGNPLFCSGAQEGTCKITDAQGTPQTLDLKTGKTDVACDALNFGCWLKGLLNLIAGFLDVLIVGPLALLVKAIAVTLASAMNTVINYVVSVPVSPTNDNTAPFVREIWNFSRALANSFFVLLLAIIGLTTILRIQSYQWQKTLPSLVIAVLLINFSGVLVGFVVDITNIITITFLKMAGGATWNAPPIVGVETLALHVGEIVFYFFIAFAYFATMLLFVLRTIALWIIAAIGPLAFALYVLPATKTYWQQWFKALFQWAIMGIPASFALMFASKAMSLTEQSIGATGAHPAFFAQAAGPFTASVILLVGMGMALAGAPAMSQGIMKFGRSLPKQLAGTRTGAKVLGGAAGGTARAIAGARVGQRLEGLIGKTPVVGGVLKYAARPLSVAEGAAGAKLIEYAATKRKWQPPKGWEQMGVEEKMEWAMSKKLGAHDFVQFAAKMGKDITKPRGARGKEFRERVLAARDKTAQVGYLQESVGTINDIMSETVTEKILIDTKIASGMKADEAQKEVQKVMDEHKQKVRAYVSDDDLAIEAGIKFNYITRQEADADKTAALARAQASLTQDQKRTFLNNTAAAMSHAKTLKPQDIASVADPKTLSFRLAMRESNPANLQRIGDNFDQATLQDILSGAGGLNEAANSPKKLRALYEQNPRLVRALFTNPVLQGMDFEGRNQLLDIFDKPTANFDAFVRRERAQKIAQTDPVLQKAHDHFRDVAKMQEARRAVQTDAEVRDMDEQIQSINDRLSAMKDELLKTNPAQTRSWEELEGIMRVPTGTQARRRGRGGGQRRRREEEYRGG